MTVETNGSPYAKFVLPRLTDSRWNTTGHRSAGPPLLYGGTRRITLDIVGNLLAGKQFNHSQPAGCSNGSELTELPIERSEMPRAGHHNLTSSHWPQFCVQPSGGQRKPAGATGRNVRHTIKRGSLTYGLIIILARPN
jgi:hypothetical protein